MELLKDLVYFIDRCQKRDVAILHDPNKKKSADKTKREAQYYELYCGLRDGRWKSEDAIAGHFGFSRTDKGYRRFIEAAEKRLYNTVLAMDYEMHSADDIAQLHDDIRNDWAVAQKLVREGSYQAFSAIARRCLKQAMLSENIEIALSIARTLRGRAHAHPNLHDQYLYYNDLVEKYSEAYFIQIKIESANINFSAQLANQRGSKRSYSPELTATVAALAPYAQAAPYEPIQRQYRLLCIYEAILRCDWAAGVRLADETLAYYAAKPFQATRIVQVFANQKIGCLINAKRYAEAKDMVEKYAAENLEGQSTWFKTRELGIANALHAQDYTYAWALHQTVTRHPRFTNIPLADQESWHLYQGYLYYLVQRRLLVLPAAEMATLPKFRLQAWLNDLPMLNRDKQGGNIPVLMLQVLFLAHDKNWDAFDNRLEALRKYIQRNLETDAEHRRTALYLRLLERAVKYRSVSAEFHEKTAPLLAALTADAYDILDQTYEVEIVPYEQQWGWITDTLAA